MNISILALDGVFDTGLTTILDAFTTANELREIDGIAGPMFDVRIVGMRSNVVSAQGFSVPVTPADDAVEPDLVVVPAIGYKMPEQLKSALQRSDVADAASWLRNSGTKSTRIAAACIGTFILAESGLLDGREATTTWWLAPLFRQRYPSIRLDSSRMIVHAGQFVTAGAALGHLDLALWLIRRESPELAALVAKYLIVDSRPSQSLYAISDHLVHSDRLVSNFDRFARERIRDRFSLDDAARTLATSKRTLTRRLHEVVGKTPLAYVQDLRIERAVHLLRTSDIAVDAIAEMVGYSDGVTLRALLRRRLGKGIRALREA